MTWESAARRLLDAAADALAYAPLGLPDRVFLHHGSSPPPDCGNGVAVWVSMVALTRDFPQPWQETRGCSPVRAAADMTLWLVRPWPTMRSTPGLPVPVGEDEAAARLLADGETLMRRVPGWNLTGDTVDFRVMYRPMTPLPPSGGTAGWQWPMSVEVFV